jgi:HEAT repeat protein
LAELPETSSENGPTLGRFFVGFLVVPGAIVLVCLAIVVGIRWLTYSGTTPEQLVNTIERSEGNVRWRAAVQLAGTLADPKHAALRQDRQLARRLTEILRRELESGGGHEDDLMLQMFLCRALGEFELDVSLPVLVDASSTERDRDVRRSALEAMALLADRLGAERVGAEPGLSDSVFTASRDGDPQVRLSAAYALGVLGGTQGEERLVAMLPDENSLVRYNAATGLARWGNSAAVDVLLEMLAPDQQAVVGGGLDGTSLDVRPELIHVNALEAVIQLIRANPTASVEGVREAMDRLEKTDVVPAVRTKIVSVREMIEEGSP